MPNKSDIVLTDKECNLIKLIRELTHGKLWVIIQDSQPIRVEEPLKSIKL